MALTTKQLTQHTGRRGNEIVGKQLDTCSRCGGFLVRSFCISPEQGTWEFQIPVWKCLQCGDLFDATILKNRHLFQHQSTN
jgi:valyl-tRNA synthetase